MADINKYIGSEGSADPEIQARLAVLDEWNETIAASLAAKENIELTMEHWEVVRFLRNHYLERGETRHARKLSEALDREFAEKGGRKYLYDLFPKGPVSQGCRIAGIPVPPDSTDPSFGSVQ